MAKKKDKFFSSLGSKVEHTQIVQLPLLQEHQEELQGIVADPEQLFDDLKTLLDTGYSVTFSVNELTGGYSVCIRGVYTGSANAGKALYCNAPSPISALLVGVFKCFVIAGMGEWVASGEQQINPYS